MPPKEKPDKKNQIAYLDQCLIKDITTAKQLHWVWWIFVLGYAGLKFSKFYRTKNKMIEPTAAMLHRLSQDDNAPARLRMDNAGENVKLKNRMESKDWKLPIKVEFTARNTPQANSHAETSFTTIAGRAKALQECANIPSHYRHMLFPYAAHTATKLDGLCAVNVDGKMATRYVHQMGANPGWVKNFHTWGEAGTVSLKEGKHPKMKNKGIKMMFVGYPDNHPADCFTMWDPQTERTHFTRDVIFLRKLYFAPAIGAGEGRVRHLTNIYEHLNDENSGEEGG